MSNGQDCALLKLVPDSLLDEAISSKEAGNTTPENQKALFLYSLGQGFYATQNNGSSAEKYVQQQTGKIQNTTGLQLYKDKCGIFCYIFFN